MNSPKKTLFTAENAFSALKKVNTFYLLRQKNTKNFIFLWDRPIKTQLSIQTKDISAPMAAAKRHKRNNEFPF
jgi:hypothetical protein